MRKNSYYFSNSKQKATFCLILSLFGVLFVHSQSLNARYLEYIDRFKTIALEHQREYGVPACITLAQGLLESNAGQSYLARRGNNHFGIKCYSWKGPVVEYDDTLKHNCYRNYGKAEDSFLDHAKFLRGKRYSSLYDLEVTDYQGWAQGLRECGYAEDPAYPQKLVNLIEQYELYALAEEPVAANLRHDKGDVPPPPKRKNRNEKKEGPPPPKRDHAERVANAFSHSTAEHQPSRAEVDHQVARNRPVASRQRATASANASTDND